VDTTHPGRIEMIVRKDARPADHDAEERLDYSEVGGLTQFGAYVETLQPGSRSSERHWHEESDELLYMLSGEATVIEDDGAHQLRRGDAACWPAGAPNAHQVLNRSEEPCTFLIFGTRMAHDIVHYPDVGRTLHDEDGIWRLQSDDGTLIKGGEIEQVRPLTRWEPKGDQLP
jgi:uncharacterized cupin superfamily protein